MGNIDHETTAAVIAAALDRATEIGSPSSVAVVDSGRNLVGFARQDDAILASVDVAQAKAFTACSLRMPTAGLAGAVQPGGPFYGLSGSHGVPYIPFGGGQVLTSGGRVIGAIGVGGGTPEQDDEVAAAGVAAVEKAAVTA